MLLHSGAGLHRHEFSPEVTTHNVEPARRLHLTRSAFSTPPPIRRNTTSTPPTPILHVPGRSLSASKIHHVRFQDPIPPPVTHLQLQPQYRRRTVHAMGNVLPTVESDATESSFSVSTSSVDDEVDSIPQSQPMLKFILSPTVAIGRSSTCIQAPRHLMQLRLVHKDGDIPMVDVHEMPLLSRNQLKAGDLRFSKYGVEDVEAFFRAKSSEIRIVQKGLQKGAVWTATVHSPNLYEFVSTDTTDPSRTITTTARWRSTKYKLHGAKTKSEVKLGFSIIHARTNHHPVLAYLKDGVLRTKHDYIATSSSKPATTRESKREGPEPVEIKPTAVEIDNATKTLIVITAMWVGLQQELTPSLVRPSALDNTHGRTVSQATLETTSTTKETHHPPSTPPACDRRHSEIPASCTSPSSMKGFPQVSQRPLHPRESGSAEQCHNHSREINASIMNDPSTTTTTAAKGGGKWKRFMGHFKKKDKEGK